MKKKILTLGILTVSILVMLIGVTLAHFTSADSVTNVFNTGDIQAEPYEPGFEPPNNWDGQTYPKVVKVKNTGKNDCFVRVSITPRWVNEDGSPFAGDVSNSVVQLGFNNYNIITGADGQGIWVSDKWIEGSDGFYYYTSILPVEGLTSELLSTVTATINKDTVDYPEDYEGKTLKVDVKVEAVQTTQYAYRTVWNISENSIIDNLFSSLTPSN